MKNSALITIITGLLVAAAIPVIRAVAKALRAHKSAGEIVADALDAAADGVEKKKD